MGRDSQRVDVQYCPEHDLEVCGLRVDHRYTNFFHEYSGDDARGRLMWK